MPSYTEADLTAASGVVISAEGMDKSGKTYNILRTAPAPLVYINCDRDNTRVITRLRKEGRRIFMSGQYLFVPSPKQLHKPGQAADDPVLVENARQAGLLWTPIERDFTDALADPKIKTVVLDSGTAAYGILRTKVFGKLTGVAEILYTKTNYMWRELLKKAENSGKVVIFIHRLKQEYIRVKGSDGKFESLQTGKLVADGYKQTNFEVGAIVRHIATPTGFTAKVVAEGVGRADLKGLIYSDDEIDYTEIVAKLTRTKKERWL